MRLLVALILMVACSAWAVDQRITTFRVSSTVVLVPGDSASKAQNAKRPTAVHDVLNAFGAKIGERWEYHDRRNITALIVQGGQITAMYEVRD